jgi:hypothetical protein
VTDHALHKRHLAAFLMSIAGAEGAGIAAVLRQYCHADAVWEIFHPFDELVGLEAARVLFWEPLKASFPDYELRMGFVIGGEYEGRALVSALGHAMGSFERPWIGIPPTHGMSYVRFGVNAVMREGKIAKAYILLDIVDLMRQAGLYPFRRMPGSAEHWAMPPVGSGADAAGYDPELGATTLRIVREMQAGLSPGRGLPGHGEPPRHSPHWHANMNWYGVAGIGSSRGQRSYRNAHGALFIRAFPDRTGFPRKDPGPEAAPGHYIQIGDGHFAVTGGWPSLHGTHLGGGWLGLPATGRHVAMRVADWYRTDTDGKLIDNWVMVDIPDILRQMGLDVLDDLRHFADPTLPCWPR